MKSLSSILLNTVFWFAIVMFAAMQIGACSDETPNGREAPMGGTPMQDQTGGTTHDIGSAGGSGGEVGLSESADALGGQEQDRFDSLLSQAFDGEPSLRGYYEGEYAGEVDRGAIKIKMLSNQTLFYEVQSQVYSYVRVSSVTPMQQADQFELQFDLEDEFGTLTYLFSGQIVVEGNEASIRGFWESSSGDEGRIRLTQIWNENRFPRCGDEENSEIDCEQVCLQVAGCAGITATCTGYQEHFSSWQEVFDLCMFGCTDFEEIRVELLSLCDTQFCAEVVNQLQMNPVLEDGRCNSEEEPE